MEKQRVRLIFRIMNRPAGEPVSSENAQCSCLETEGMYYKRGDAHYCLYEEQPEGWEKPYNVMLKWKGTVLERQIRGEKPFRMVFEPGTCHCDFYHTPYGNLLLDTETDRLEITEDGNGFFLELEYGVKQEGQLVSENRMEIHILSMDGDNNEIRAL